MTYSKKIIHKIGSINTKTPEERVRIMEESIEVLRQNAIDPRAFEGIDDCDIPYKYVETCKAIPITIIYRAFTFSGSTLEVSEDLEINENLSIVSLENSLAFANGYKSVIIKNIERKNIENE